MSEANSIRQSEAADVLGVVASPEPSRWPPPAPKAKRRRRQAAPAPVPEPAPVVARTLSVRVRLAGAQCPLCGQELPAGRYATVVPGGILAHTVCG
jgi:hypothetical protein